MSLADSTRERMARPSRGEGRTVLFVSNYRPDVGFAWWLMENFWVEFAQVARRAGLRPVLVYPHPGPVPASIHAAGIETVVLPFPGTSLADWTRALRFVRARNIHTVYFTDRRFASLFYLLLRAAGVKNVINHDHTPGDRAPVGGLKGFLKVLWHRLRPVCCDLQICVSPLIQERAVRNGRVPIRRTTVVQNGIVPVECGGDAEYAHRTLNLSPSSVVCVTVGRAHPYKRLDFVIEVARRCVKDRGLSNLVFVHCGDGPDMGRLRKLVAEAGLESHFIFGGRRDDVRKILCAVDLAIHAAQGEAFSLSILEYMSACLPVLVPDIPSVSQAITDRATGLVYPDGDADAAAALIGTLLADRPWRVQVGEAAALEVRERYTLDAMNRQFRSVIEDVLMGPVRRRLS